MREIIARMEKGETVNLMTKDDQQFDEINEIIQDYLAHGFVLD